MPHKSYFASEYFLALVTVVCLFVAGPVLTPAAVLSSKGGGATVAPPLPAQPPVAAGQGGRANGCRTDPRPYTMGLLVTLLVSPWPLAITITTYQATVPNLRQTPLN